MKDLANQDCEPCRGDIPRLSREGIEPLLAQVREELGGAADPLAEYRASGYQQKIEAERGA